MSGYKIHVRVIQTKISDWYDIVEKTAFFEGKWSEDRGEQTLTMDDSGTSGILRFSNPQDRFFLVVLGVHDHKRWCDITVDATSTDTGTKIHPTYYDGSGNGNDEIKGKQLASVEKTSAKGEHINVNYYKESGKTLYATITVS